MEEEAVKTPATKEVLAEVAKVRAEAGWCWTIGCFTKTLFQQKKWRNPPRISLGVSLKGSKRIFDLDHV